MNTYGMDLMGRRRRRRHSAEFKAAVIEECLRPGVSIAAVALAHGLNANMLRKWVTDGEHKLVVSAPTPAPEPEAPQMPSPTFIPLALHNIDTCVNAVNQSPRLGDFEGAVTARLPQKTITTANPLKFKEKFHLNVKRTPKVVQGREKMIKGWSGKLRTE